MVEQPVVAKMVQPIQVVVLVAMAGMDILAVVV
jgi:hypothetical protein